VASLGTATICFQTTSGELLAYDTDVIQLNLPELFGLLLMRVAKADVLVSSIQLRSPTWPADLREHGGHLYVKEKRNIVTSNYLEAGVLGAVNFADKPVVNYDDTPESAQNRPQKAANVISFSALSNMHTQFGHAGAEPMLRFLEGGILPAGVDFITRIDIKRVISNCNICERFGSKPLRPRAAIPSDAKFIESVYIGVFYIDGNPVLSAVCAGTRYTAAGVLVIKSTADLWDTHQRIWMLSLTGCPLNIRLESASEHRSDEMSGLTSGCGIELQFSPVEAHWSLGTGERVHSLIRNVYHKVRMHAFYLALKDQARLVRVCAERHSTAGCHCCIASSIWYPTTLLVAWIKLQPYGTTVD
jgi:hypothetical protein